MSQDNRAADRAEALLRGHERTSSRKRNVATVGFIVAVIAMIALASFLVSRKDDGVAEIAAPRNATDTFGFLLTPAVATGNPDAPEAPVKVALYEDFLCPTCGRFESESGAFLRDAVAQGRISLEYRPFTFLIGASTNRYTQRAANAAACVADTAGVGAYAAFHDVLYANQPAEGGPGPDDDALIAFAEQAGAPKAAECIRSEKFEQWIVTALEKGREAGVESTPTVTVNNSILNVLGSEGRPVMPGTDDLERAIAGAGG